MSSFSFLMPNVPRTVRRYITRTVPRTPSRNLRIPGQIRHNSTATSPIPPKKDTSLGGKIKDLSRKYGKAAVFVYLGISLVDFGVAFAAVHSLGTERIGAYEDAAFKKIKEWTGYSRSQVNQVQQAMDEVVTTVDETTKSPSQATVTGNKSSLWTEIVIAYGIHKALFIFARVPITVAITPSIVKGLVKRGWKIGPQVQPHVAVKSTK